jgi:glycosyltransferase involved in cell wall biosynthesis/GT2 family glycosyltransferase
MVAVTVVIPCYNPDPEHLKEAIGSVLRSSLTPHEIVLVDDGSTRADSQAALAAWATVPGVRCVHHGTNRGLAAARNTGMQAATTPLVLQLDADDMIGTTFLEKAVWALICHPEWAFVNSWVQVFGANNYVWDYGFDRPKDFLTHNQVNPIALIRREADRAIGGHDESIRDGLEDWDYWLKMAAHGYWGGTLPEVLSFYRHHPTATFWANRDDPAQRRAFRAMLRARYPQLWRSPWPTGQHAALEPPGTPPVGLPWLDVDLPGAPLGARGRNLLLLLPWLKLGGADRFNLDLTSQLRRRGWAVSVVTTVPAQHEWHPTFADHTDAIYHLPHFLTPEAQVSFLVHLIRQRQIDVVMISNSMLGYAALPVLRAYCPQTTFIDYHHVVVEEWLDGGFVRIGVDSQAALDLSLCSSDQVRGWMTTRGAAPERLRVVRTGLDSERLDPDRFAREALRQQHGLTPDTVAVLFPARLDTQKRPAFVLGILAALKRLPVPWVCLFAGDGPQRWWVEALRRWHTLRGRVRLLGAVHPDAMPELYAACDLVILPSRFEGISLALYEAMSMALPVVAADVGGQAELVTPETGILIPRHADEHQAYIDAIAGLLTDRARRTRMGQTGRARILSGFSLAATLDNFERAVDEAKTLHVTHPRPALPPDVRVQAARDLIAAIRNDNLQARFESGHGKTSLPGAHTRSWGTPAEGLRWMRRRIARPVYYWLIRHRIDFFIPLAQWLAQRFNRLAA